MALGVTKTPKNLLEAEDKIGKHSVFSYIPAIIATVILLPINIFFFFVHIKVGFVILLSNVVLVVGIFLISIKKIERHNYLLGTGTYLTVIVLFFLEKLTHTTQVDFRED